MAPHPLQHHQFRTTTAHSNLPGQIHTLQYHVLAYTELPRQSLSRNRHPSASWSHPTVAQVCGTHTHSERRTPSQYRLPPAVLDECAKHNYCQELNTRKSHLAQTSSDPAPTTPKEMLRGTFVPDRQSSNTPADRGTTSVQPAGDLHPRAIRGRYI